MVFASNNKGKLREIRAILGEDIKSLKDVNVDVDVLEDGETFYDNAKKKAYEIYNIVKEPVISDDSGLCVDYLDGFPGVHSKRFLGEDATPEDINNYILEHLDGVSNRKCEVICTLVYYDGKKEIRADGILEGKISLDVRGTNGCGFDSIVELSDGKTMAEHTQEEKNNMSARYLAAVNLRNKLQNKYCIKNKFLYIFIFKKLIVFKYLI